MSDGKMSAWSFTVAVFKKNFGTSLTVTPLRQHCIGHKKLFLMEGIKMAWLISKTDVSTVCGSSYATAASKVVTFLCLALLLYPYIYVAFMIVYYQ